VRPPPSYVLGPVSEKGTQGEDTEREIYHPIAAEGAFAQSTTTTRAIDESGRGYMATAITTDGHSFSLLSWDNY